MNGGLNSLREEKDLEEFVRYVGSEIDVSGQALKIALTNVAKGMAKKTPQKPHNPPNRSTATIIAIGWRLTTSENNKGTNTLPSKNWITP